MNPQSPLLAERIRAFQAELAKQAPPAVLNQLASDMEELLRSGVGTSGLRAGQTAPDFTLPDARGAKVALGELLQRGKVVLTFYRGDWCPYCDLQLRAYQEILPRIEELHATLVAVSPQTPDNSLTTAEKRNLKFAVLSDVGNRVARSYGLVFTVPKTMAALFQGFGVDLAKFNGDTSGEIPAPGTFIIGQGRNIEYAFVEGDYRKRLEPAEILRQLERR